MHENYLGIERRMQNKIEIDAKDLTRYILRHWLSIILITLIMAASAFGVTKYLITPVYESQSMIYITSGDSGGTVVQNMLSSLQAGNALTADYKTLATSKPVLEQVIKELKLDMTYEDLKKQVSTENPDDTRILILKVRDTDPQKAKDIVNALTEIERDQIANIMNTTKPNIMQWGDIQKKPVSLSPIKASAIAGFITLCILLILFFFRFIQNDNICTSEDIEKVLDLKNLAEIPLLTNDDFHQKKGER
jgi:capsular polysaccharide biosynthesis protein